MRPANSLALACSLFFSVLVADTAPAAVWTESPDSPGEPVTLCLNGTCERTRYVTRGSTGSGSWTFFELANGYAEHHYSSEFTGVTKTIASMGNRELSPAEYATVRLERGYDEVMRVELSENGRFLFVEGWIDNDMLARFEQVVRTSDRLVGVSLRSPGGDAEAALGMGRLIVDRRLSTFVPERGYCREACSTLFLAGYDRKLNGLLVIAPLVAADGDQERIRARQLELLVAAENRFDVITLIESLDWNQSYRARNNDGDNLERDLPGDALTD